MDCGANGEVLFCAISPLPTQSLKITDPIWQRIGSIGRRKEAGYQIIHPKEQRIVLTENYEKSIMENNA